MTTLVLSRDEMVERAARELHHIQCPSSGCWPWEERPRPHRALFLRDAERILVAAGAIPEQEDS
jgi:hypothetical protein